MISNWWKNLCLEGKRKQKKKLPSLTGCRKVLVLRMKIPWSIVHGDTKMHLTQKLAPSPEIDYQEGFTPTSKVSPHKNCMPMPPGSMAFDPTPLFANSLGCFHKRRWATITMCIFLSFPSIHMVQYNQSPPHFTSNSASIKTLHQKGKFGCYILRMRIFSRQ